MTISIAFNGVEAQPPPLGQLQTAVQGGALVSGSLALQSGPASLVTLHVWCLFSQDNNIVFWKNLPDVQVGSTPIFIGQASSAPEFPGGSVVSQWPRSVKVEAPLYPRPGAPLVVVDGPAFVPATPIYNDAVSAIFVAIVGGSPAGVYVFTAS